METCLNGATALVIHHGTVLFSRGAMASWKSALDARSNGPGSSPGRGQCVVLLGETLLSQSASAPCDGLSSRESDNTPSHLMLQTPLA